MEEGSVTEQVAEVVEEAVGTAPKSKMEKAKETVSATAEQIEKSQVVGLTHQYILAWLGAGVLAKEETEKFLKVLVERGAIAEGEARRLMKEAMKKRKHAAGRATRGAAKIEAEFDTRVEEVLARMNIPTKTEIEALSSKIATLTKKVDALRKEQ
jgi:poly(hydroxyalkanoate) granule-associated protein